MKSKGLSNLTLPSSKQFSTNPLDELVRRSCFRSAASHRLSKDCYCKFETAGGETPFGSKLPMILRPKHAVLLATIVLVLGFVAAWIVTTRASQNLLDHLIAFGWGDGKYGKGFYGAHVYLKPERNGYSVRARVMIGRGSNYYHDCGIIGTVTNAAEAVQHWGVITWKDDGFTLEREPTHSFCRERSWSSTAKSGRLPSHSPYPFTRRHRGWRILSDSLASSPIPNATLFQ